MTIARRASSEELLEQAVDGAQGLDGDRGVGLGPVVDQPLRALVHRIQHLEPAGVVGREQVDELGLQLERLAVGLASLGLAHRVQQHVDGLGVSALGRAGVVQRGLS